MADRRATIERNTAETETNLTLDLDEAEPIEIATGIGFLDHLFETFATHAGISLVLECSGDTHVDDHHTAEDCAIALGQAVDEALGDRVGIARFGDALLPMDDALVRAAIDFSGRPYAKVDLAFGSDRVGELATENVAHLFRSFAMNAEATLHLTDLAGENDHHRAEAATKAVAKAVAESIDRTESDTIPSTKGSLE